MKRYGLLQKVHQDFKEPPYIGEQVDGEYVRYEDARIAIADALDKHQHLMDHYMLLKAKVAKMEEAISTLDGMMFDVSGFHPDLAHRFRTYIASVTASL